MSTLLTKRMIRKKYQGERNKAKDTAQAILRHLRLDMFLNIRELEKELIDLGVAVYTPLQLKLRRGNHVLEDIRKIQFHDDDVIKHLDSRVMLPMGQHIFGPMVTEVIPSLSYIKDELIPFVEERGMEVDFLTEEEDWYTIRFTVKGEYDVTEGQEES